VTEPAPDAHSLLAVENLIEQFLSDPVHKLPEYKEDWTRTELIEPMLEALGWKHLRQIDLTTKATGFVREAPLAATGRAQVPDYAFYVDGRRRFYLEAKKPYVNIEDDVGPAFQIREYGWNASDPIGVLTDFEEWAVYNCRFQPLRGAPATEARIDYVRCEKLLAEWPRIYSTFSPAAIAEGSLEKLADEFAQRRTGLPPDKALLAQVQVWRKNLAQALVGANENQSTRDLNWCVQVIIDRILFLRIAAARGLESESDLSDCLFDDRGVYPALLDLFRAADTRYNSGLFHFSEERNRPLFDDLTPDLAVPDEPLNEIIRYLTSQASPFRFNILPADILGQMYEQMLGTEIVVGHNSVAIEEKPEVRKAGGVFYTPGYVVDRIVDDTVGPLVNRAGVTPGQLDTLRIVDPSCGSGSFLLGAYQYLLDWHLRYYVGLRRPDRRRLTRGAEGEPRLTLAERKRILINNIYGVDIDPQAVEVAKLSLLLKVIEGETQTGLAIERLLPDLDHNIVCGNSLVGSDFYASSELVNLTPEEWAKVNALDWAEAFPEATKVGGFDAVVGNPPWLMAGYYLADSKEYMQRTYSTWVGKADLYYLFLEKALRLVNPAGRIGMIVPSKMFHTGAAKTLRGILVDGDWVESITDFGLARVFQGATNYSTILQLRAGSKGPIRLQRSGINFAETASSEVHRSDLTDGLWNLLPENRQRVWHRLRQANPTLASLTKRFGTGAQTGADPILLTTVEAAQDQGIERTWLRPTQKGRSVRRYALGEPVQMLFPYSENDSGFHLMEELDDNDPFWQYLLANREKLSSRKYFGKVPEESTGRWYGMPYLDAAWTFSTAHILTPSISDRSNFAIGNGNLFVNGTAGVTSIIPDPDLDESIWYLLAVLNSSLVSAYITDHSTPYQGGYFKFSAPYLRGVPIYRIDFDDVGELKAHDDLATLAQSLAQKYPELKETSGPAARIVEREIGAIERRIDSVVSNLYGLSTEERAAIS
jgi:hypothetical protein